jgi:hypothetical protein
LGVKSLALAADDDFGDLVTPKIYPQERTGRPKRPSRMKADAAPTKLEPERPALTEGRVVDTEPGKKANDITRQNGAQPPSAPRAQAQPERHAGNLSGEEREWYESLCSDEEFQRICAIPIANRTNAEQRAWSDRNWWAFS